MSTWKTCPMKLYYVKTILENANNYEDYDIRVSKEYMLDCDINHFINDKQTIDDIKKNFKLSNSEFKKLINIMKSEIF